MIRTLTVSRRSNNMEGVLQVSKSPNHENHSTVLQTWQCDQQSREYDDASAAANLLSAQVAVARLANSSSPDSGLSGSDLLPPELNNLDSASSLLSNDVSSSNPTADFLLPKTTSIWGTGDSEYSCWAQESLSRSSGSMDDSSLLSSDTLGNDTSRLMDTSKSTPDSLMAPHWPLANSQSSPQVFQRRSWTSAEEHTSLGLLIPNISHQGYTNSFPTLSSSASGLDASKFNMDYLGERSMGNFEATSPVYDAMARKIHNQMSGLDSNASGNSEMSMSSMGFSALQQMGQSLGALTTDSSDVNTVSSSSGLFSQHGLIQQQHKNYNVSPIAMDHDKSYLTSNSRVNFFNHSSSSTVDTTNAIMTASATSNQRFGENMNSPKLLLESLSGNSVLNISSPSESVLGSHNYLYSTQKKVDPLESLRHKWPNNAGVKDFTVNSGLGNLGRFTYSPSCNENNGDGLYDTTWPPSSIGPTITMEPGVPPMDVDSRKRFLQMTLGQPSNNNNTSHKRLHMETQNGQTILPASAKRSSSWASSLTSTCSKAQDSIIPESSLPYTNIKSNSRHAVGPALNTNLKPRARQGSANDPQSIAARHRRERISERLKVLQDLVPNGSKVDLVTMLEKAINYVKFLQLQVKVLTTDDYWPSNEKGAAPCTALPNFEDMEGALKVLVAQVEKEANSNSNNNCSSKNLQSLSPGREESASPDNSDSM